MIRPLIRWGLGSLLILLLALVAMVAAVLFLPSGTRFALDMADTALPQIRLQGVNGTLTDSLSIDQVEVSLPGQQLVLDELQLVWRPWELFDKQLHVLRLSALRLQVDLSAPQTTDEPEPQGSPRPGLPELPAIELPLGFSLDLVRLDEVLVRQEDKLLTPALSVELAAHSEAQRIVLSQLQVQQGESRIEMEGWTEPARQFLSHLDARVSGRIEDWWAPEHWQDSKPFVLQLAADFDGPKRVADLVLDLTQAETALNVQVEAMLADQLVVTYGLKGKGLDPALVQPEWPGRLALEASGQVDMSGSEPQLDLQLAALDGTLRQQSIHLQGNVSGGLEQWRIEALKLRYAGARADVDGRVGLDTLDLNWLLDAPDLATLLPDAAGKIALKGQVKGALTAPSVDAQVDLKGLRYADQLTLAKLEGPISVDLSGGRDWHADLRLEQLEAAGQSLHQARLQLDGQPEKHRLQLSADASAGQFGLDLRGGWQTDKGLWDGRIEQLELKPEPLSHWRTSAAAPLRLTQQDYRLGQLCLEEQTRGGALCLDASGSFAGQVTANIDLDSLELALLTPLLNGAELTPNLSAQVAFNQAAGGQPELTAELTTSAGKFTPAQADQSLPLEPIRIRAALKQDRLTAEADTELSFVAGSLGLNLDIADLSSRQRLQGKLEMGASDLSLIEVLVPDLQNMSGRLAADFTLSGSLAKPAVNGALTFQEGSVEVPAVGLLLSPLELSVRPVDAGERLEFSGRIGSGEGELSLGGQYNLEQKRGGLTLSGERLTAMNTGMAQVEISPDLTLQLEPDAMRLSGDLVVPKALIATPESRESAVMPSGDVVLLENGEELTAEAGVPIYANINVELGDDVRVDALGFEGRLLGKLNLEESPGQATRATGSIQVESGQYRLYGQDLDIRRGSLVYTAGPIDNPGLDLRIGRGIDDVVVGANVSGTLREPRMDLYGEPAMPDSSVLSYLLLGKPPGESSSSEQQMLTQAALSLGMAGGNLVTDRLRESLTLDEFGFDSSSADGSSFFIGKYLSPRLYLRYGIGVLDAVNTLSLKYKLTEKWRLEAQSSELGSGGDILYTLER